MTLLQCSARCGHGQVTRRVTCLGQCDQDTRPHTQEACRAPGTCQVNKVTIASQNKFEKQKTEGPPRLSRMEGNRKKKFSDFNEL